MKKYSIHALKVIKVLIGENIRYLICKYNDLTDTYIEILTNERLNIHDNTCVEPLSNYYSILSEYNQTTEQPLILDKEEILQKYLDINSKENKINNKIKINSMDNRL